MNKSKYNNPYHPFPYEMRGQFFERFEENKTRFIEIYSIDYKKPEEEDEEWEFSLYSLYIDQLIRPIIDEEEVFFLYKLRTYYADPALTDNDSAFNQSITSFEQYVFSNFDELLEYAEQRWKIGLSDFVPINETHIPY
ncbi:hypothetical protein A9G41_03855 [Gilliamella sp. Nev5-1]|uniref:hypothetical protein n=1 Tax=unclassified Gilliamella TaxID=2685620 RepID=UPI00080DFDFA|nr:hypothetical protein [Gilliamella apicola]OCG60463.1 hypothetical protein A9G40_03910 [Gilliamella apicola]OCG71007.1 hypothetical protein A9G41_03855 [Gilliamella apicola]